MEIVTDSKPILKVAAVTGATGFLASNIVKLLLDRGYTVHASVRSKDEKKTAHLRALNGSERIIFFEADLLKEGSYDELVADVDVCFHTASPYVLNVTDAQTQLVDPAVKGTINVLESCTKSNRITRVVLTSSMAAITDSPQGLLTEEVWNEKSSLTRNPYYYSKTCAEKAAWKFMEKEKRNYDLVVMNPWLICGPSFDPGLNESNKVFLDILTGAYPVVMGLEFAIVDVRDVSLAHVLAAETPEASGRYVCCSQSNVLSMQSVCDALIQEFPDITSNVPHGSMKNLNCTVGINSFIISTNLSLNS
jgi:dihydroflavonol-4-reductase